jgi:3,4-dihydroxy-2-butanone 4-phosphate synthase
MSNWLERAVRNEISSRERNEWIESANLRYEHHHSAEQYVCECSDHACTSVITLSLDEYEHVRAEATHFAIAVDHENPEIDRVVSENERFAVVEKFLAMAKQLARATDPRR